VLYFTNTPIHRHASPDPKDTAMNAFSAARPTSRHSNRATPSPATRPYAPAATASFGARRERDFGVGYGSSSGYATSRSYTTGNNGPRLFRCV